MLVFLIGKELEDALGNHGADLMRRGQFLSTDLHDLIDCAIATGQQRCTALTNVANAKPKEQSRQTTLTAVCNGLKEISRRFFCQPLQFGESRYVKVVEIGKIVYQTAGHQLLDYGCAQTVNIHGSARAVMQQSFAELGWTGSIRTT